MLVVIIFDTCTGVFVCVCVCVVSVVQLWIDIKVCQDRVPAFCVCGRNTCHLNALLRGGSA